MSWRPAASPAMSCDGVVAGAEVDLEGRALGRDVVARAGIAGAAVGLADGRGRVEAVAPLGVERGGCRDRQGAFGDGAGAEVERHDVALGERGRRHVDGGGDGGCRGDEPASLRAVTR